LQPLHLVVRQPEKIAHHHPRQFGSLNHAGRAASSRLMGPDPRVDFSNAKSIRDLGFEAGRLMASYVHVLNHEDLYANVLSDKATLDDLLVGSYWYFGATNFRTKKVNEAVNAVGAWKKEESVIYRVFGDWKLICQIDPRWITTSTAYVMLRGGTLDTMGLVHLNSIDAKRKLAVASPLFLGAPDRGGLR
ncbi:hypothetical protein, partial [Pseudotabrizicola alkalilacus]|uniref:hypothetical protein n=1 Tax=Pseudotabrizicola alkalilacus TaxID=2305252 RepID=UPI001F268AA2